MSLYRKEPAERVRTAALHGIKPPEQVQGERAGRRAVPDPSAASRLNWATKPATSSQRPCRLVVSKPLSGTSQQGEQQEGIQRRSSTCLRGVQTVFGIPVVSTGAVGQGFNALPQRIDRTAVASRTSANRLALEEVSPALRGTGSRCQVRRRASTITHNR